MLNNSYLFSIDRRFISPKTSECFFANFNASLPRFIWRLKRVDKCIYFNCCQLKINENNVFQWYTYIRVFIYNEYKFYVVYILPVLTRNPTDEARKEPSFRRIIAQFSTCPVAMSESCSKLCSWFIAISTFQNFLMFLCVYFDM